MAKIFLVVRKADNRNPVSNGVDGALVVAADADAARTAAIALTAGDPDGAWAAAGADAYDLSGSSFATGEVQFSLVKPIVAPAT